MKLFRIAKQKYIKDFSGEGAKLYGGRWNKRGTRMLYFSTSLSLSVLETLVHFNQENAPDDLYYVEIEISNKLINTISNFSKLKAHLRDNPPHYSTQLFGSKWADKKQDLALAVPSAILLSESNIIVNPLHDAFSKIKTIKVNKLELDARLFVSKP
ncbi:RES family NAD+ phosphorylase [Winogradskyella litorisediminis]|uniref:RES family NAD+ phosphorylase n=1 Tax=Winogradskyella litorisediminis TaxID=1156618 RepID=A0ABW3N8R0_9FLAO